MPPKIDEITSPALIALDLDADDRWAAIDRMVGLLDADGRLSDPAALTAAVRDRETHSPTGMEMGVAIPHGQSEGVSSTGVVFARATPGIDFGAPDGTPADLLFLIAAPAGAGDEHLTVLSRLARRLVHPEFRDRLRAVTTADEAVVTIRQEVAL